MKNLGVILRRELGAYFNSAIAAIFVIVFILFNNGIFMMQFFQSQKADMRPFFNALPLVLTFFIPAVTMRLWAEERKGNTLELLLTFPMRPYELVLGKYLASLIFYVFALAATLTLPVMIARVGTIDPGPIVCGYVGAVLIGALFLAAGIFISGLCKDQIVAFILSMLVTFTLYFIGTDLTALFLDGWIPGAGTFLKSTLGLAGHLVSFSKGVLDLKDIAYFIVAGAAFLILNGLSLDGRFRPKAKTVFAGAVALCLVAMTLTNWLLHDLSIGRLDLTEGKLYTISDASKRILRELKVPVQIKLYISPSAQMPSPLKTLEREVADKLEELRIASEGRLQFKIVHLDSSEQDDAALQSLRNQGVAPFQVESIQRDEVGVKLIYATLVIQYKEKPNEIIPRVLPQTLQDLEYQLLSRIYKLTTEEKPKISIFAPLEAEELSEPMRAVLAASGRAEEREYRDSFKTAELLIRNNGYRVARIALTREDAIPEDTRMLLILNPGEVSERQRYEINRYLRQGGTVVVAAQGFDYTFSREQKGVEAVPARLSLSVNELLQKWGVKIDTDILMDEHSEVISLTTGQTIGPFSVQMPVKFPNQIMIGEADINREAVFMNRIPSVAYLWGSALEIAEDVLRSQGLRPTVLFTSSARSWKMPAQGVSRLTDQNVRPPAALTGRYPLAVLLEGTFSDAYEGKEVPPWASGDAAEATVPAPKAEARPGRLVVMGCSKAFSEDLIQSTGNINLFANLVDGLTLGDDLVRIRSKAGVIRDLRKVSNAEKIAYKFFTVLLVPMILVGAGLIRLFLRRQEKEMYRAALVMRQGS